MQHAATQGAYTVHSTSTLPLHLRSRETGLWRPGSRCCISRAASRPRGKIHRLYVCNLSMYHEDFRLIEMWCCANATQGPPSHLHAHHGKVCADRCLLCPFVRTCCFPADPTLLDDYP